MRIEVNGIGLNVEVAGEGPALLLLHGFTGSAATWAPLAAFFDGFRTIAVDLIGHGASDSPADPARYRMERCVQDLAAALDRLGVERAAVVGYSMGGRVALRLALAAPERLWALILESASPGIDDPAARAARVESDHELVSFIEREGLEAFVDRWENISLFASQKRLPQDVQERQRRQRLRSDPAGLANSLRGMGGGVDEPVLQRLNEIAVPALLVAGELDAKYCALARRMAAEMPDARVEIVPETGHAAHLERPDAFGAFVRDFLRQRAPQIEAREGLTCP